MRITSHKQIDDRIFALVSLCVAKIDADPLLLRQVRSNVERIADERIRVRWRSLVDLPWAELKVLLLARSHDGDQLRQDVPFGGLLSNAERLPFYQSKTGQETNP